MDKQKLWKQTKKAAKKAAEFGEQAFYVAATAALGAITDHYTKKWLSSNPTTDTDD